MSDERQYLSSDGRIGRAAASAGAEPLEDALRELIRVSKSAGMNAASDLGYLPSSQQADDEEISEAVQAVYRARAQGGPSLDVERLRRIENALLRSAGFFPWEDPHGDAWIHEDDEGYVMDREQAVNDALARLSVGEPRPESLDPLAAQEADMCPNCVTPWKCNGPHLSGEPRPSGKGE